MTDVTTVRDAAEIDLDDRSLYFNRELSWLQFNARVLELAEDPRTPLLERLKFCAIVSSNLDEFFMVRVAGLHDQIDAGIETPLQDGRTPSETIEVIRATVREHIAPPGARARAGAAPRAGRARHPDRRRGARSARPSARRSTSASGARSSRS